MFTVCIYIYDMRAERRTGVGRKINETCAKPTRRNSRARVYTPTGNFCFLWFFFFFHVFRPSSFGGQSRVVSYIVATTRGANTTTYISSESPRPTRYDTRKLVRTAARAHPLYTECSTFIKGIHHRDNAVLVRTP